MIAVFGASLRYRVAVAELARTARTSDQQRGAVCVVGGETWWIDARNALDAGAAAIVVERPRVASAEDLSELEDVADGRPVVIERPHLREDAVHDLIPSQPKALVVECAYPSDDVVVLRDAVGWVRVLGTGTPRIVSSMGSGGRAVAALSVSATGGLASGQDVPVSLVVARRRSAAIWLRATVLGADRLDVLVVAAPGDPRVTRTTVDGRTLRTEPRESAPRRALRRAAEAVGNGTRLDDLEPLRADDVIARAVVTSAPKT